MCIDYYSFCIWGKIKAKKYDIQSVLGCFQQKNLIFFHRKTYSWVSNKRGGQNKQRSWQILTKITNGEGAINREVGKKSPKLIHGEVGISGPTGKNTAIRNFIEIKPSNNLVKISTKRTSEIQR